jgi:hypothetical protein
VRSTLIALTAAAATMAGGATAGAAPPQPPVPPPTLSGVSFHQDSPTITSVDCTGTTNFTYSATGVAAGPYPGTFTETGALTVNRLSASFTIDSAAGQVTGTKTANVGVSCGGSCAGVAACALAGASYNTLPGQLSSTDTYTATIRTAAGTFIDTGLFGAVFYRSADSPLNGFDSSFASDLVSPTQVVPTGEEQCKGGGWRAYGFKNQGRCLQFVKRPPAP